MKECLFWCDAPVTITGFATVSRNILKVLDKTGKYRFTVLGISHQGLPFNVADYPYLEYPKHGGLHMAHEGNDIYGMGKVVRFLQTGTFDILFILNDPFVLKFTMPQILKVREGLKKKFKIIFYFPTDCPPKDDWAGVVNMTDFPVAYTNFGRDTMSSLLPELGTKLRVIPHGTDKEMFKPIPGPARDLLRKSMFGAAGDKFIILNVNRNQPRKDLSSTFSVFAQVKAKRPNAYLYILGAMNDAGGNLQEIALQYGLVLGRDWNCPNPNMYNANQGMPIENVVQLYAAADLVITTTLGEGWGLSVTEAMACKKPIVAPRHSSLSEIIGENQERGWLVGAGGPGHTLCLGPHDNSTVRPMVHQDEMVDRIKKIIDYPGQSAKKIEAAFNWVPTWEEVGGAWRDVFEQASLVDEPKEEVTNAP